jgi:hypothetical protein
MHPFFVGKANPASDIERPSISIAGAGATPAVGGSGQHARLPSDRD